jgi:glycosyltransferase involved in cell wall biosynthesis
MKDPHTFLAAASLVASQCGNMKFVCVGNGLGSDSSEMQSATKAYRLDDKIIWAGEQDHMPKIYNSFDLLVSSSRGEGFSNAIAEAMACAVPCVGTAVGDSALIVGKTGLVVPSQNPQALAEGILTVIHKDEFLDGTLQKACRNRIIAKFDLDRLIANSTEAFQRLLCSE